MPQPLVHDADALLLQFVESRDIACPRCGYNLRDLSQPRCPECEEQLTLSVGVARLHFGWYLIAIIPCMFSGIATIFFSTMLTIGSIASNTSPPLIMVATALNIPSNTLITTRRSNTLRINLILPTAYHSATHSRSFLRND